LRALGFGFLFSAGIIGAIIASYLHALAVFMNITPFIIFAIIAIIGAISITLTKETFGKYLRDSVN